MKENKYIIINDSVIKEGQFCNNQEIETIRLPNKVRICTGAFKDCRSLKSVEFELGEGEITIEDGAFECCINLKDFHFMFHKEPRIMIGEYAFSNTKQQIIFHTPVYRYRGLEEYARRHNYKVMQHL